MFKMIILQQSASQKLEGKKVVRQLFLTYLIQMFSQSRVNTRILILLLSSQLVLLAKLTNYIKTCCTNPNIFLHLMHTFFKQLSIFLCLCQAVLRIRIFRIRMVSLDPAVLWSRSRTFQLELEPEPVKKLRLWLRAVAVWLRGTVVAKLRKFL